MDSVLAMEQWTSSSSGALHPCRVTRGVMGFRQSSLHVFNGPGECLQMCLLGCLVGGTVGEWGTRTVPMSHSSYN